VIDATTFLLEHEGYIQISKQENREVTIEQPE
jgi:hypothetical protein